MGSLYRRKQRLPNGETRSLPTWWIKYYRDGRAVRESTGTDKETVARRILRSTEGAVEHGLPITPKVGRVSVEDAATDLVNDYVANGRRSLDSTQRRIDKHLLPFFRGRRLASITTADMRAYIAHLKEKGILAHAGQRKGERIGDVSNAEINNELKTLSRMFTLAFEAGKVLYVPKVPKLAEHNARHGFFEVEQFAAVRQHLPAYLRPLVTFMHLTGWRISEVRGLEWRQVDFQAGEIRLDPNTTKNDEGRVFPLHPRVADAA